MNRIAYRRRWLESFRMIAYDSTAASAAGMAGLCRPSAGISDRRGRIRRELERGASECGRRPSGRPACGGSAATVVGSAMGMVDPVEVGSWPSGGAIGTPRPGWM